MIYEWKIKKYSVDAQVAGEELERIAEKRTLTPEAVVEESTHKAAPLHNEFEWNNKTAAHEYRKCQAQDLIRNIVTVTIEERPVEATRAFVNIITEEDRGYIPIDVVIKDTSMRNQYIEQALKDLAVYKKKYADLIEIAENFDHLDDFENKVRERMNKDD
jgi:hypothetical protein